MSDVPGLYVSIERLTRTNHPNLCQQLANLYLKERYRVAYFKSPFQYTEIYLLDTKVQYTRLLSQWLSDILEELEKKSIVFCDDSLWTLMIKAIYAVENPEITEIMFNEFRKTCNSTLVNTPDLVFYLEESDYILDNVINLGYDGDKAMDILKYFSKIQQYYMKTNPGIITREVYRIPKEVSLLESSVVRDRIKNVLDLVIPDYNIDRL